MTHPDAPPEWQRAMLAIAENDGDFLPLGDAHYAFFAEIWHGVLESQGRLVNECR